MKSISIIIVTYNSEEEIVNCINSLLPQLKEINGEIIVIDNNSYDNTISLINNISDNRISIIQNEKNLGYTKANNQGINHADGEYVLLLNPDTIIPNNTINNLVDEIRDNKYLSVIAPQLRFPNGKVQNSCRRFPRRRDIIYESFGLGRIFKDSKEFNYWKMIDFDHSKTKLVDQPAGAALLIPKKIINEIGLLDEQFPMFFSDVDYCRRIRDADYSVFYTVNTHIIHKGGASIFRKRMKMIISSHYSFWKYFNKYKASYFDSFLNLLVGIFLIILIPIRIVINLLFPKLIQRERRSL